MHMYMGKKWVSKKFKISFQDFAIHNSSSDLHCRCKEQWWQLSKKITTFKSKMLMVHTTMLSPKYTCTRWDHAQSHSFTWSNSIQKLKERWFDFLAISHSPHVIAVKDGHGGAEERVVLQASCRCFMCNFHGEKCWWCMPGAHKSKSTICGLFLV